VSPDVNSVQVVIKRERAWSGSLLPWIVWLDGQNVGTVHVGGSLTVPTSPGQHDIVLSVPGFAHFTGKSEPFRFNAEVGDRIDLTTQASMMSGRPKIWRQDMPTGQPPITGRLEEAATQWPKNLSTGLQSSAPVSAEPATAVPKSATPTTSTLKEGSRYEVPLGEETRTIDNSKSSSSTQRVVKLTREWAKTYTLDVEHDMTVDGSAGLGIHVLDLKAEAERTLRDTYSVASEERETFEEDVTLNIAKHTKSEINFFWKEIRQKGIVQISGADFEARIPYEVTVGITFDQQQVDTP
jgi:hypothetical protein